MAASFAGTIATSAIMAAMLAAGSQIGARLVAKTGAASSQTCTVAGLSRGAAIGWPDDVAQRSIRAGRLGIESVAGQVVVIAWKGRVAIQSRNGLSVSRLPGEVFPKPGDPAYKNVQKGWINSRLIEDSG